MRDDRVWGPGPFMHLSCSVCHAAFSKSKRGGGHGPATPSPVNSTGGGVRDASPRVLVQRGNGGEIRGGGVRVGLPGRVGARGSGPAGGGRGAPGRGVQ